MTAGTSGRPDSSGLGLLLVSLPAGDWPRMSEVAAELEDVGASAIWVTDHLFWHQPAMDCLSAAASVVAGTRRVTVGTGVLQLPLRSPAAVAKAASYLQVVADGRFVLGVGAGEHRGEYEAAGISFDRRGRVLDDGIEEVARAWSRRDGRYAMTPQGPAVPIWIGGRSRHSIERTARSGDGWMPIFVTPEQYEQRSGELDDALRAVGRAPEAVARAAVLVVAPRMRQDTACRWLGDLYRMDPSRFEPYVVGGDAASCASRLMDYRCAGVDHVALMMAGDLDVSAFGEVNDAFVELGSGSH